MPRVTHFFSKIAGVTEKNGDHSDRQAILWRCHVWERLVLDQQEDNPVDSNAVAILRENGEQLGFLRAPVAQTVVERTAMGYRYAAFVSNLTGGTRRKPTRGANLLILEVEPGVSDADAQDYVDTLGIGASTTAHRIERPHGAGSVTWEVFGDYCVAIVRVARNLILAILRRIRRLSPYLRGLPGRINHLLAKWSGKGNTILFHFLQVLVVVAVVAVFTVPVGWLLAHFMWLVER